MVSTATMGSQVCDQCAKHGFPGVSMSVPHRNNCSCRHCRCTRCGQARAGQQGVPSTSMSDRSDHLRSPCSSSSSTSMSCSERSSARRWPSLDAVSRVTERLKVKGFSPEDINTFSLYLVFKKNGFSIDKTIAELNRSRNAIAESLVSSVFAQSAKKNCRTDILSANPQVVEITRPTPQKSSELTAKKSFPNSSIVESSFETLTVEVSNQFESSLVAEECHEMQPNVSEEPIHTYPESSIGKESDVSEPKSQSIIVTTNAEDIELPIRVPESTIDHDTITSSKQMSDTTTEFSKKSSIKVFNRITSCRRTSRQSSISSSISGHSRHLSHQSENISPLLSDFKPLFQNKLDFQDKLVPFYSDQYVRIRTLTSHIPSISPASNGVPNGSKDKSNANNSDDNSNNQMTSVSYKRRIRNSRQKSSDKKLCAPVITSEAAMAALEAIEDISAAIESSKFSSNEINNNDINNSHIIINSSEEVVNHVFNGVDAEDNRQENEDDVSNAVEGDTRSDFEEVSEENVEIDPQKSFDVEEDNNIEENLCVDQFDDDLQISAIAEIEIETIENGENEEISANYGLKENSSEELADRQSTSGPSDHIDSGPIVQDQLIGSQPSSNTIVDEKPSLGSYQRQFEAFLGGLSNKSLYTSKSHLISRSEDTAESREIEVITID